MIGKPRGRKGMLPVFVYDPSKKSGKRYAGQAASLEDARKLELQAKLDTLNGKPKAPKQWTVDIFAEHWLEHLHGEGTKRPEPTTRAQNRQSIKAFRADHGSKPLGAITRDLALRFAKDKPHQAKAVAAMFADALDTERIDKNPFARIGIRPGVGRSNIDPLTEDEIVTLAGLAGLQNGKRGRFQWPAYVTVAAWTGLRPGEMCALHHSNVDWKNRELNVDAKVGNRRNDGTLGPPKHKKGRFVPLSDEAYTALAGLRRTDGFMFRSVTGKPLRPNALRHWWIPTRTAFLETLPADHWLRRRLMADPDDHLDVYEARHFFGSMLADRGMSARDISKLMGNTEAVCAARYLHTYEDRLRDRARAAFGQNVREIRSAEEKAS